MRMLCHVCASQVISLPKPSTLNPQPSTLSPQPSTLNPKQVFCKASNGQDASRFTVPDA